MDILCAAGVTRPQPINGPGDGEPEYLVPRHSYDRYITPMSPLNAPCAIDPSLLEDNNTTSHQERSQYPKPRRLAGQTRMEDPIARARAKALGLARVGWATLGSAMVGSAVGGSAAVGLAPVGSAVVTSAVGGSAVVGSAPVGLAAVQSAPVGSAPVGSATIGSAAVGSAPVGLALVRSFGDYLTPPVQNSFPQLTPPSSQIYQQQTSAQHARRTADDLAQQEALSTPVVGRRQRIKRVNFADKEGK
jgi:hypothetical protein